MKALTINLYRLHVFQTVARRLSFSGAAEELHTSQPNISKHIRQLENELGVLLFDRLGGRIALTDAGRVVFDYSDNLFRKLDEMRRALDELEGLERGCLRLGASSTPGLYIVPPILAGFRRQFPALEVTFLLDNSREIVRGVLNNQVELGFVEEFETMAGIQTQPFAEHEYVLIAAASHPLARREKVTPQDLSQETFIWREVGSGTRTGMDSLLQQAGVQPRHSLEFSSCEGIKRAVAAGLGLSVVSRHAIDMEMSLGRLSILDGEKLRLKGSLNVITCKDHNPSSASLAFLSYIRKG